MKKLLIEEKAKRYDDAIEKLRGLLESIHEEKCEIIEEDITDIFPELKESEDERIRKEIINYFDNGKEYLSLCSIGKDDILAWLEKQNCQKSVNKEYTFKSIPRLLDMIESTDKAKSYCKKLIDSLQAEGYSIDAKIVGECFKRMNGEKVAMAVMDIEKQGEKKPIIEMITPEESLGIDSETYNKIVDECIYGEQKHDDKVEPKFKVGDWIINRTDATIMQIVNNIDFYESVEIGGQRRTDSYNYVEWDFRLWTIADAKDGDVLDANGAPFIYKKHSKDYVYFYCGVNLAGDFIEANGIDTWDSNNKVYPATKEQRDLLFQKMHEAGYEWDAEKKELRKIHVIDEGKAEMDYCFTKMMNGEKVSSAWDEKDEKILKDILVDVKFEGYNNDMLANSYKKINWLKSIKDRVLYQNRWKPSDEQMQALLSEVEVWTKGCPKQKILESLYNDLKKLT